MIASFRHKGLSELFEDKPTAKIDKNKHARVVRILDALDAASSPGDMNLPGLQFHPLEGKPTRYSVHVNGPWCVTFEFEGTDAYRVDFEQYH